MTMNQRQAVYVTTMNVLADHDIPFDDGQEGGVEPLITKEMRKSIVQIVALSILCGDVEMSAEGKAKYSSLDKMKVYANGLISNWFRKDKRLNGNSKYEAKNPGSRAGVADDQIKALKALRQVKVDDKEAVAAIDKAIEARKAELGAAKQVELTPAMIALIPADLQLKLGLVKVESTEG